MFVTEGASTPAPSGFYLPLVGAGDAVSVGGGGSGGTAGAFEMEFGKIVRCGLMFGRRWLSCADAELPVLARGDTAGAIYASVYHPADDIPRLTVRHSADGSLPASTLDVTNRLLYRAETYPGSVAEGAARRYWADYRSAITMFAMD